MKPGLYLINVTDWGIHPAGSTLVHLSSVRSALNDVVISRAKRIANEEGIHPFNIDYIGSKQKRKMLYTSN